jgi:hypothetical protein
VYSGIRARPAAEPAAARGIPRNAPTRTVVLMRIFASAIGVSFVSTARPYETDPGLSSPLSLTRLKDPGNP